MKKSLIPLLIAIGGIILLPLVVHNPYYIHLAETILIYTILLFGLDIVVGYVGQVSLGHAGLFGIGSYTAGILFFHLGWPIWATIPASIVVTSIFGGILALPALKVVGPYLAMVTLAFGTIAQILINEMTWLTEGPLGIKLTRPELLGVPMTKAEYFWLVAAFCILAMIVIDRFVKSQMGRAFEALRDSPIACDCMGVSVYRFKVIAFVISAAFAGLAGCLYAYSEQYISPNTYNNELAVLFLLGIIMGGRKSRLGALIGAAIIVLLPKLLDDINLFRIVASIIAIAVVVGAGLALSKKVTTPRRVAVPIAGVVGLAAFSFWLNTISDWRLSIFGFMILLVVYYLQNGIVGFAKSFYQSIAGKTKTTRGGEVEAVDDSINFISAVGSQNAGAELLKVDSVLMQFGGLKALNNVDLSIKRGTIHGLIGPNGSGKSTMMNVLTGIYVPTAGNVLYAGESVVGKTSSDIALSGIARTFQNVQLFGEMTAIQNILVGLHHTFKSNMLEIALDLSRYKRESAEAHARAMALLKFVGLDDLANEEARNLPYGKQRLLEIARALALDPELLLLDEPAAGLTAPDIKELLRIIRKIRDNGITFILIEHHMDVVMSVCDTVSVLDFGQKIAEGKPAEVQANEKVIHAYLGT
jgi:ABC-type branched-subunit amino acid transport system ATPase component/ABC-type branched-subunit amino acid transport system permease subunit